MLSASTIVKPFDQVKGRIVDVGGRLAPAPSI
jgi:hypothetical protein